MVKVVVTGMGLVSALGPTLASNWQRLLKGESGIALHQPFPELLPQPLALVGSQPSTVGALLGRSLREALTDARLKEPLRDCGVVIGSSRGFQAQWEQQSLDHQNLQGSVLASAAELMQIYGQSPATLVAQTVQTQGPVLGPRAACATGIWAIVQGAELLRGGYCDRVLVGAVEAPITPLTLAGFQRMGAMASTGAYPFDRHRQGFVLGEGAALLVLETEALAQARGAQIYGQVLGMGLTVDAYHISAPDPSRCWAKIAIQDCLERSGLTPEQIGYIHAHGTATQLNDHAEADVIQSLFPPTVAVSSTKGATGHTLGASGVLGAVFCLLSLSQQRLPPCTGLSDPDFDLNFVRAARPWDPRLSRQAVLCCSSGFGGQNTVLALSPAYDSGNQIKIGRRLA